MLSNQKELRTRAEKCFEVCYPQRNAFSVKKSKTKTGKIRHVSQDIRHLHEIPRGKGLWDTIRSSLGTTLVKRSNVRRVRSLLPKQVDLQSRSVGGHCSYL